MKRCIAALMFLVAGLAGAATFTYSDPACTAYTFTSGNVMSCVPVAPPPGQCPAGQTGTPPNCVPSTCPPGQIGTPPNCTVPPSGPINCATAQGLGTQSTGTTVV